MIQFHYTPLPDLIACSYPGMMAGKSSTESKVWNARPYAIHRSLVKWLIAVVTPFAFVLATADANEELTINNPYEGVSWEKEHRHKANFHTHTTNSYDGRLAPHQAVDGYKAMGYSVLAITDHDKDTYPWTEFTKLDQKGNKMVPKEKMIPYEDRDPEKLGMLSIEGVELSREHHIVNLWNYPTAPGAKSMKGVYPKEKILDSISKGGQLIFAHPGRHGWATYEKTLEEKIKAANKKGGLDEKDTRPDWVKFGGWPVDRYVHVFREQSAFIGLEVYNSGDRYPKDRELWDLLLKELMPDRPVWGFSNDDMHSQDQMGLNQNYMLVKENTEEQVKNALAKGQFFYAYCPKAQEGSKPPYIERVTVDHQKKTISITVNDAQRIEWISDGKIVGTQPTLDLTKVEGLGNYVRVMIYGAEQTVVGTQPFGVVRKK